MRGPINAMGENNKLKTRLFKDVIAFFSFSKKKEGEYICIAGRPGTQKLGKKYKNRRGRLIIMKLIKRAGPQVILGPSGRNTRIQAPFFIYT